MARKFSRLQTWERGILRLATSDFVFAPSSSFLILNNVYDEITLNDCQRAINSMLALGYLEVSSESDPSFRNRPSYVCSSSGRDFQILIDDRERKLLETILMVQGSSFA